MCKIIVIRFFQQLQHIKIAYRWFVFHSIDRCVMDTWKKKLNNRDTGTNLPIHIYL